MISGRQALATIEQTIGQARGEEARLDAGLKSAAGQMARVRAERMDAFRALARLKLDTMTRDGMVRALDAAERQALDLLAQRRQAFERLMERRRAAEQAVKDREAERHAKAAALEEALKPIAALRQQIEAQVRASPEWAAQRARIEDAPTIAAEAEKKAAQAEADRQAKRKPYEADPLFMYLWRKKFGRAEDRSGPLVRFFDRRIARLIGYDKARANYALLNEIPQRLREHAERMKAEIANAREQLKAMEREALVKTATGHSPHAPVPLRRTLTKLNANGRRVRMRSRRSTVHTMLPCSRAKGPTRMPADAQESLQALYREAMATPAPEDDAIVRRIEATDGAVRWT